MVSVSCVKIIRVVYSFHVRQQSRTSDGLEKCTPPGRQTDCTRISISVLGMFHVRTESCSHVRTEYMYSVRTWPLYRWRMWRGHLTDVLIRPELVSCPDRVFCSHPDRVHGLCPDMRSWLCPDMKNTTDGCDFMSVRCHVREVFNPDIVVISCPDIVHFHVRAILYGCCPFSCPWGVQKIHLTDMVMSVRCIFTIVMNIISLYMIHNADNCI